MTDSRNSRCSAVFDAISHERRRRLILIMSISPKQRVSIRYLAEFLAVFETGDSPREIDAPDYALERQSLQKSHLKLLEKAGIIEREGESVIRGDAFENARDLLLLSIQQT